MTASAALVIIPEQGGGNIRNVTFENIEIYRIPAGHKRDRLQPRCHQLHNRRGGFPQHHLFIRHAVAAEERQRVRATGIAVSFQNVTVNGTRVTTANSSSFLTKDANSSLTIS